MAMNPEIKERWIAALESGEYEQTVGVLHRTDGGYCCLGVLCDILKDELGLQWEKIARHERYGIKNKSQLCDLSLPPNVMRAAGLNAHGPDVKIFGPNRKYDRLASLNDRGYTFRQIAEIIREHL